MEMVHLFPLEEEEDIDEVRALLEKFWKHTGSDRPKRFLDNWEQHQAKFVKVYPNDYRRVLQTQKRFKLEGLAEEEAIMAAFEENAHDLARIGGK
jgi:glutamate synthase (ferredoxin)